MRELVLFFELYSSLRKGEQYGLLGRNLLQYVRSLERGEYTRVSLFTYDSRDHEKLVELKSTMGLPDGIRVLTPPRWLDSKAGSIIYSLVGPLLHARALGAADVYKTQQVSGSWAGLIAKHLFGRPLLFRLGYPLSPRFQSEGKPLRRRIAEYTERLLVRQSDHVAVTSREMKEFYRAFSVETPITVVPSYADITGFTPIEVYDHRLPILYVGRLEPEKNVTGLIEACARLQHPLVICGTGRLEPELRRLAASLGGRVDFRGSVPNSALQRIHHEHTVFAICSPREGMPKALIEAMASGMICVGTRTQGICELIEDGVTGHLIDGIDAATIERKLRSVLDRLDPQIGHRAREFVCRNHSLEHAMDVERHIMEGMLKAGPGPDTGLSSPRSVEEEA